MDKALVYAVNTSSQVLAVNSNVSFGSAHRKLGCACKVNDGNLIADGEGHFKVNMGVSLTAGGAGILTLQAYKNGVAIAGAEASRTVADATGYAITLPEFVINNSCCEKHSVITLVISGVAATVTNAAATLELV